MILATPLFRTKLFFIQLDPKVRSSFPEMSCKNGVLRKFAKFTGKHLCQSLFFNKVAGPATLLKKRLWHRCFPVNFANFLRTLFSQNTSGVCLRKVHVKKKSCEDVAKYSIKTADSILKTLQN